MSKEEESIEKGIATLEVLKAQMENLQKQMDVLQVSIQEHERAIETLQGYRDIEKEEVLVPIGAGVFISVQISEKKGLISIGNQIFTQLPIDKIIEKLEERKKDMEELLKKLSEDSYKLQQNYAALSAKVEDDYRKYMQARKDVQTP